MHGVSFFFLFFNDFCNIEIENNIQILELESPISFLFKEEQDWKENIHSIPYPHVPNMALKCAEDSFYLMG